LALFDTATFDPLRRDPEREVRGSFSGIPFAAKVVIPGYGGRVARDGIATLGAFARQPRHAP
jgi:hypothetical protein